MDKTEIIKLLVSNHYFYEDTENVIDVRIKNKSLLTLYFKDHLLVDYSEKVKYYGWWKWTTLKAMFWREIICFIFFVLLAILDDLYLFGSNYPISIFLVCGITTIIIGLSYFFYFFYQIKKTKNTLQLHK